MTDSEPGLRLWRMRRRHQQIDATLAPAGPGWVLTFARNQVPMVVWRYGDPGEARAQAEVHRVRLERAGWVSHW